MPQDGPIVFISHFQIKEGRLGEITEMSRAVAAQVEAEKPRTLVWLSYVEGATRMSFVHVFADRAAMDEHFEGAARRSRAADEHITPLGWEIYGSPSEEVVDAMRREAEAAGVSLTIEPDRIAGFLRLRDDR